MKNFEMDEFYEIESNNYSSFNLEKPLNDYAICIDVSPNETESENFSICLQQFFPPYLNKEDFLDYENQIKNDTWNNQILSTQSSTNKNEINQNEIPNEEIKAQFVEDLDHKTNIEDEKDIEIENIDEKNIKSIISENDNVNSEDVEYNIKIHQNEQSAKQIKGKIIFMTHKPNSDSPLISINMIGSKKCDQSQALVSDSINHESKSDYELNGTLDRRDALIKKFKKHLCENINTTFHDLLKSLENKSEAYRRLNLKKLKLVKMSNIQNANIQFNKLFMNETIRNALTYENEKNSNIIEKLEMYDIRDNELNNFMNWKVKDFTRAYINSDKFEEDLEIESQNYTQKNFRMFKKAYRKMIFGDGFHLGIIDYVLKSEPNKKGNEKKKNKKK